MLHFIGCMRQRRCEVHQLSARVDKHDILDPHAELFLRNVNARLNREHSSRFNRDVVIPRIMHVQSDKVTQPVDEVLSERLAVEVKAPPWQEDMMRGAREMAMPRS